MSNQSSESDPQFVSQRIRWLEHKSLSSYQTLILVAIQTLLPAFGAGALITSSVLWVTKGPAQALANVELFIHFTVASLMGFSLLAWVIGAVVNGSDGL